LLFTKLAVILKSISITPDDSTKGISSNLFALKFCSANFFAIEKLILISIPFALLKAQNVMKMFP